MSGVSGANDEVTPQSPLRPGPQTPHSISREAGGPARHGFWEIGPIAGRRRKIEDLLASGQDPRTDDVRKKLGHPRA